MDDALFSRTPRKPTRDERDVARAIYRAVRENPIRLRDICSALHLEKRYTQSVIESLRFIHHLPIGASKRKPRGYFWIRNASDFEAAITNFVSTAVKMIRTAMAFAPEQLRSGLADRIRRVLRELEPE